MLTQVYDVRTVGVVGAWLACEEALKNTQSIPPKNISPPPYHFPDLTRHTSNRLFPPWSCCMSRPMNALLRPRLLAAAIAMAVPLAGTVAYAAEQGAVRSYNLPAGPLASTLN